MARGQPDYGMYAPTRVMAGMSDMAEAVVRLNSIDIFDRFGRVAYLDDFEGTVLKWDTVLVAGGTAILDSTDPKSGSQDALLSLANAAGSASSIYKYFLPLLSNRIGSEISFVRPDKNTYFHIVVALYTGARLRIGEIRIDFNAGDLAYINTGGLPVNFATGLNLAIANFIHHPCKLVVDFDTIRYVRFLYGGVVYDLSAHALWDVGNLGAPNVYAGFHLRPRVQAVSSIYLDDFILTQDEP